MHRSPWHKHRRTSSRFDYLGANLHPQSYLKYIPRFIIAVMNMPGRNQSRRISRAARVCSFRNDQLIVAGTQSPARPTKVQWLECSYENRANSIPN